MALEKKRKRGDVKGGVIKERGKRVFGNAWRRPTREGGKEVATRGNI